MCIIIAKRAGIELDNQELESAMESASIHNCHGIGFALKTEGSDNIILSKGYMYYQTLIERINKLEVKIGDELMVHMRYATSGDINTANCHPYVVSDDLDEILIDEAIITDNSVVSHNGTFPWYVNDKSNNSDTVNYIKEYLSSEGVLEGMRNIEDADYYQMFQLMQGNRLCIIHPDRNISMDTFGSWNKRKDDSLVYSNYYHIQPHEGYKLYKRDKVV